MNNISSFALKRRFVLAVLAFLAALAAAGAATFAWYLYNASAHTTKVHMAAGTSAALYISSSVQGPFTSAAVLDSFTGTLHPVSTDRIQNGFQQVTGYSQGDAGQASLVASLFGISADANYYHTRLYLRSDGAAANVYLANIAYQDSDAQNPISTAVRVGLVVPDTGEEYIFAINTATNPEAQYNTASGKEGSVLDSSRADGTTVPFAPLTPNNYCQYDAATGTVTVPASATAICSVGEQPMEVDVYIWLEGCDEDCTNNLCAQTLRDLALSFCTEGSSQF